MCFSATASFATSGLLTLAALIGLKKTHSNAMKFFALTPLLFAIQQSMEGIMWQFGAGSAFYTAAAYIFLVFASSWPALMSSMLVALEHNGKRRKVLVGFMYGGIIFSVCALMYIATAPMTAQIVGAHIAYEFPQDHWSAIAPWARLLYVVLVVLPPLLSTVRFMWLFGLGIFGTFLASIWWYSAHVTSVWCFFAAVLSGLVLFIVWKE